MKKARPALRRTLARMNHPDARALLLLAAFAALFFWPVWIAGWRFPKGGGDLWGQIHPVWSYVSSWLRHGVMPLWNTVLMAGDPIVAEGQYGLFYPLNWPLFLASPLPAWLVTLRGTLSLWLAGAGLYTYLRHSPVWRPEDDEPQPRTSQVAALVGATAYMFADPFIAHLGHPQFNDALSLLPWLLWGIDGALRRAARIPLAGLLLGMVMLSGHGQAALYTALIAGAYALWQVLEGGRAHAPRRMGRMLLVGALGLAIAAPGLLPGLERLPHTERALVPWDLRRGYEFPPEMLADLLAPGIHGRGIDRFWPEWNRVESAYVGAVALGLAVLGLCGNLHRRRTWFLVALGLLAYLFALGYRGPIYPRVAALPLLSASWKTARAIFGLSFALAIGAAMGVELLVAPEPYSRRFSEPRNARRIGGAILRRGWVLGLLTVTMLIWLGMPYWKGTVPPGAPRQYAQRSLELAALACFGTAFAGWGIVLEMRWGRPTLLLLLVGELILTGALVEMEPAPDADADPHAGALAYLRADPGWFRVDVDAAARGLWSPAALQAAGFESPQGSGNPMELAAFGQFYWAVPHKGAPAYQLFGAKYVVVPKDALPGGEGIWPVFTADPTVDLHLNTNAMNRVWLVYDTLPVATVEEAYTAIFAPDFEPGRQATIAGGPDLDGAGSGSLEVWAYGPNRARFGVHTSERALLVLSDIHYPGWHARLDGALTPIYRTDGIFRGVIVPPGDHEVEMWFFPTSLRLGLGGWGLALLGIAAGAGARRRRGGD